MHRRPVKAKPLTDHQRLIYEIRPCDVLLVAGRSRVSDLISYVTKSPWTHSALYLGRINDIEDEATRNRISEFYSGSPRDQLVIESIMGKGTIITPISFYENEHIRICRPIGLSRFDAQSVINYAVQHLGLKYDIRQIFDLYRFLIPWKLFPRRWLSTILNFKPGEQTKEVCSTLIAEAFHSVHFPILPAIIRSKTGEFEMFQRNPRLFTPSDFDYSPYFEIIKYPMFEFNQPPGYHNFPWNTEGKVTEEPGGIYHHDDDKMKDDSH